MEPAIISYYILFILEYSWYSAYQNAFSKYIRLAMFTILKVHNEMFLQIINKTHWDLKGILSYSKL